MWCEVIRCRQEGLRLRKSQWPAPIRGLLQIEELARADNNFRHHVRMASLYALTGVSGAKTSLLIPIFDPQLLPAPAGQLLLRGIEITSKVTATGTREVYEFEQLWLCTPTGPV